MHLLPRYAEQSADLGPREPGGAGRKDSVFVSLADGSQIIARSRQRSAGLATVELCDHGVGFVAAVRLIFVDSAFELLKRALTYPD
jgi:hypothetical protein